MLSEEQAHALAHAWIRAFNSHDLDEIVAHYEDDVVLVSPVAARILGDTTGTVKGKPALRAYFKKGLEAFPDLKFELKEVMWGLNSLVLYYVNQNGVKAGEFMQIGVGGKIAKVVAHYHR